MDISKYILDKYEKEITSIYHSTPRTSQIQMSLDIAELLFKSPKRIILIEAPVGTGKTLGALFPTILYAKATNARITYATATKNLQEQILDEDIPAMQKMKIYNPSDRYVLAMGKDNYFCLNNLIANRDNFKSPSRYNELKKAANNCFTGLRKEMEKKCGITDQEWELIKIRKDQRNCNNYQCSGHRYRNSFRENPFLTITNHNQLIQSQINELEGNREIVSVLPGIVIIDEAHLFSENYLGSLQKSLSLKNLKYLNKKYFSKTSQNSIYFELKQIEREIKRKGTNNYGLTSRHKLTYKIKKSLESISYKLVKNQKIKTAKNYSMITDDFYDRVMGQVNNILKDENISWFTVEDQSISYIPKDFFTQLKETIISLARGNKVILLSGTLTSTNDPLKEVEREWGIQDFVYKSYSSPFKMEDQVYLCLPKEEKFSNPRNKSKHGRLIIDEVVAPLTKKVSGGMLILSNSLELKDCISNYLGPNYSGRTVLTQGHQSNGELTKIFKNDKSSILIGSGSFKSGFSVPGPALQSEIITSLPFPINTDPFIKLKVDNLKHKYNMNKFDIIYNMMLKDLKQEMGRLVRSIKDYGVIVIADSRIYTKNYGIKIIKLFKKQGYNVFNNLNTVNEFLKSASLKSDERVSKTHYSRDNLVIPIINYSVILPDIFDSGTLENQTREDNFKKYINKAKKWRREYNKLHSESKIAFKGMKNIDTTKDLIKVVGDALYKVGEDYNKILKEILGNGYVVGQYKPNYNLKNRTSGKVHVSYITKK
ncbi:ATP-dependent DNA helicase [Lactobacillus intestinalis]|uniref:ATP-dependent DNA helicase n=1 Tax=Lactobacillus intestinalis TaxID=151781 RepID=UPI001F570F3B|nr:ATP-dependent DNA helicase [Lactobacillus intestinalis]